MSLIECNECGKEISDRAASCPNCGNPITISNSIHTEEENYLGCPNCKSKDLHTGQKGFSVGKAVAGVALTGGIGILAGTIGSKDIIMTCLSCGTKFKAGEAIKILSDRKTKEMNDKIILALKNNNRETAILICKGYTNYDNNSASQLVSKLERDYRINIDIVKDEALTQRVKELILKGDRYGAFKLYQNETGLSPLETANYVKGLNISPNENTDNNQYNIPFSVKFTDFFLTAGWKIVIVVIVVVVFLMLLDSLK